MGCRIDWLLTGEGTMSGRSDIDIDLLRTIQLYIGGSQCNARLL